MPPALRLRPIPQSSLVDQVGGRIRDLIDRGNLAAGDRIPSEADLVRSLHVSRPVLREAISRLEATGLVVVRRGLGTFVGDRGSLSSCMTFVRTAMAVAPRELAKLAELRAGVECRSARLAAQRATALDLEELSAACERMDDRSLSYLDAIRADFEFHRKIVAITRNEVLINVLDVIQEFVTAGMVQTTPQPRNHDRSRTLHGNILAAVRAGDPDGAERAMHVHMESVREALVQADRRAAVEPLPEPPAVAAKTEVST